jgi:hypothetical protein
MNSEPTLETIDDYDGKESNSKKRIVKIVVLSLFVMGVIYAGIKYQYNSVDDYVGTQDKPGINTSR